MCVCLLCTDLAAWVHVEQTHSTRQLFGILNAVPQYTGGEVQWALIRLKKNTHTHIMNAALKKQLGLHCILHTNPWLSVRLQFTEAADPHSAWLALQINTSSTESVQNSRIQAERTRRRSNHVHFYYASERLWFYSSVPRLHFPKLILSDRTTLILSAGIDILPWVHCMTKLCSALSNLFCTTALSTNNTHFSVSLLVSIKMHIYNFFLWDIHYKLPDIKIPQRWSY